MKAAVISNGNISDISFMKKKLEDYEIIVCADGAGEMLRLLDIDPDVILGDLDSIKEETIDYYKERKVEFVRYNPEKDYSDTHICVDYLIQKGYKKIDIYGALGGRWDHSMANFGLLYYGYKKQIDIAIIDNYDTAKVYGIGNHSFSYKNDCCWSIFAVFEDAVVSISGMKYPLDRYTLNRGESIGLSNEYVTDCKLDIIKGSTIVIESLICRQ